MIQSLRNIWNLDECFKLNVPLEILHSFYGCLSFIFVSWYRREYMHIEIHQGVWNRKKKKRLVISAWSEDRAELPWCTKTNIQRQVFSKGHCARSHFSASFAVGLGKKKWVLADKNVSGSDVSLLIQSI